MEFGQDDGRFVAHNVDVDQVEEQNELKYPVVLLGAKHVVQAQVVEVERDQKLLGILLQVKLGLDSDRNHRNGTNVGGRVG